MPNLTLSINSRQAQAAVANLDISMKNFNNTINRTTINFRQFDQSLNRTGNFISAFTKRFLAYQAAFAALRGIKSGIDVIRELDEKLVRLQGHLIDPRTSTDQQVASFGRLSAAAREMGNTTRFSMTKATDAFITLTKAGLTAEQSMQAIVPIMKFASIGMLSMDQAVKSVTDAIVQFKLGFGDAAHVTDVLTLAAGLSKTEIVEITNAFQKAAPIFAETGNTIEEVAALLMVMADAGRVGVIAGTSLRSMMNTLIKPTREQADILDQLGINLDDTAPTMNSFIDVMQRFQKANIDAGKAPFLFERRNVVDAIRLIGEANGKIVDYVALLNNAGGTTDRFSALLDNTLNAKLDKLAATFQQMATDTGDSGFLGLLKDLVDALNSLTRATIGYNTAIKSNSPVTEFWTDIINVIKGNDRLGASWLRLSADLDVLIEFIKMGLDRLVNLFKRIAQEMVHGLVGIFAPFLTGLANMSDAIARFPLTPSGLAEIAKEEGKALRDFVEANKSINYADIVAASDAADKAIVDAYAKRRAIIRVETDRTIAADEKAQQDFIKNREKLEERTAAAIRLRKQSPTETAAYFGNLFSTQPVAFRPAGPFRPVSTQQERADEAFDHELKRRKLELSLIFETNDAREKEIALYEIKRNVIKGDIEIDTSKLKAIGDVIDAIDKANISKKIKDSNRDIEQEIKVLGLSNDERERQNEIYAITKDLSQEQVDAIQTEIDGYTRLIQTLQLLRRVRELADQMGDAFGNAVEKMIFQTDKLRNVLRDLVKEINQAVLRAALTRPLSEGISNLVFAAGKGLRAYFSGPDYSDAAVNVHDTPLAVAHGTVVNEPTFMRSLSGKRSIMSEAGTEGILPLSRDSSGRLGVSAVGGGEGGRTVIVNQYISTPDANSFRKSKRQIRNDVLKTIGRRN